MKKFFIGIIVVFMVFLAGCSAAIKEDSKIVFGNIIMLDGENPVAEAVVVKEGKIVFVGDKDEAMQHRSYESCKYS